jgi:hypothetical protein
MLLKYNVPEVTRALATAAPDAEAVKVFPAGMSTLVLEKLLRE